jgi:hypothetical protein
MNRYLVVIFILFCLSISIHSPLTPFVSYDLLVNKDTHKCVLLLGDFHDPSIEALNEQHATGFINTLELSKKLVSNASVKPIQLFVQLNEELAKRYLPEHSSPFFSAGKTTDLLMNHALKADYDKVINIVPFDPRSEEESSTINGALACCIAQLSNKTDATQNFHEFIEQSKEAFIALSKETNDQIGIYNIVTVKQYLTSLEAGLELLKRWQDCYEVTSTVWLEIENLKNLYSISFEQVRLFFTEEEPTCPLHLAILNILSMSDGFSQAIDIALIMQQKFTLELDYIIAEAGFLHKILEHQAAEQSKTILVAGSIHTAWLADLLKKIGYSSIASKNALVKHGMVLMAHEKELETLSIETMHALRTFLDPAFPYCLQKPYKACHWCQKPEDPTKKLLSCGRCNGARYCNKRCQTAHWLWHKQECCKAN